jgi:hypothetical protein
MPWTRMALRSREERRKLNAVGSSNGWKMEDLIPAGEDRMFQSIWSTQDKETTISYFQDDILGHDLFFVQGPDHEEAAEKLREKADVISRKEALDFAEKAKEGQDLIDAAYIIAATGTEEFDKRAFEVIERLSESEEGPVRHAAALAMGYLGWEQFVPLLGRLADDEDTSVRESARSTQRHWPPFA